MTIGALLKNELRRIARIEIKAMAGRLRSTQRQLAKLRAIVQEQKRTITRLQSRGGRKTGTKRILTLSPARRAALKLQGQYMGHVRGLGPLQKRRVKALKEAKGYP